MGEHYLPTQASTFFGNPKAPKTRLAVRAGLPDVYVDLARYLALTEAEIRAMLAEIERGLKQPACC